MLSSIKVLDLSRVLAGPWTAQNLADLGADVIKVERPSCGDDTRAWGPPFLQDSNGKETKEAAYYLGANRGKQSIAIDITTTEGQALIKTLAQQCDVVIENYKVGGLARYQLDYENLSKSNPRLVYCSITGFGQSGPLSHLPGYDFIIQAMGGLMSITGEREGEPQKLGVAFSDLMTGMYSTVAILAALYNRELTGKGKYIDMALLDVQIASLANMNLNYLVSNRVPIRNGNAHPNIVPYQVFHAKDMAFVIAAGNDSQFKHLCKAIKRPELAEHPKYIKNESRVRHRQELVQLLAEHFTQKEAHHWIKIIQEAGVPCGPINTIKEALENPQVKYRGLCIDLPHPLSGTVPQVVNPIRIDDKPSFNSKAPPTLGQHTGQILRERLNLSEEQIQGLRDMGVIQ